MLRETHVIFKRAPTVVNGGCLIEANRCHTTSQIRSVCWRSYEWHGLLKCISSSV